MCPNSNKIEHNLSYIKEEVKVEISAFHSGEEGVSEYQLMLHPLATGELFEVQLLSVLRSYKSLLTTELPNAVPVFMRFFVSDAANQAELLHSHLSELPSCAVSIVEQAPLDGSKVSVWVYLQTDVQVSALPNGLKEVKHGDYCHYWSGSASYNTNDSEEQTRQLLNHYVDQLGDQGCNLADHCIRTWFFVQNVDVNYAGVVKARNEVFEQQNLTSKTHYISSTGINGRHADHHVLVQMDTYAVKGLQPQQIHFLYASTHLNPTYEYGVSFERGTYVDYGDRRQVFISGTASINNKGEVLHLGNIKKQTERMLENVEVLLQEAACGFSDIQQLIVYLRDVTDYKVVHQMFEERFPNTPKIIVYAPVCRPGWLIEMECIAIKAHTFSTLASF